MRYRMVGDNPTEEKALKSSPAARPLFDPFLPVLQARSIMAGVRTGVFQALGKRARTAGELATELSLDADCLELLLRVLVCAGYVNQPGEQYRLTELARNTLLPGSPMQLTGWVEHNYAHWRIIDKLEEVLKTGKGIGIDRSLSTPEDWAVQQRAMLETARPAAPLVASLVPVKEGARKMLDVGGSHGLYGAMICRKHPPMRSEVLESPQAVEHAKKLAREEKIDDVVSHRAGDALKDDLGRGYDAVFMGNINHHFTPDQNQKLLHRIREALVPSGTVAIWEFKRPDPAAEHDLAGDGLALFFRISSGTRCYTVADYTGWIESAGFTDITVHPTPFAPAQILVTGRAT
jgi:predicted O-methyltransferase YrrM